ncbi:transcription factor SPEECHLESS-like [Magnolia sinica]|uniref:transcription factor SPEECHLESS-like n=1 Tax=Magnolia sinica TaxID=86752 RepID=UPI002658D084|nr:transcription factor SPEECHLESS-like [Magnolia sinica]
MADSLSELFDHPEFCTINLAAAHSPENFFAIISTVENALFNDTVDATGLVPQISIPSSTQHEFEIDVQNPTSCKRRKLCVATSSEVAALDGPQRMSHITVERNRRKQMNQNLSVLRSLMPCFYVKRGDQASTIEGVVNFIKELQHVLQFLEAKKRKKTYNEVLSPRSIPLSPRPPQLSSRASLPISPRTPQPTRNYDPRMHQPSLSPTMVTSHEPFFFENAVGLSANSKSLVANVEVKFSAGSNVLLKTMSHRIPGQVLKIITALEGLSLEILHASIRTVDDTMLNSFTIKIGIECELSAEDLAQEIQRTFC